MKLATLSLKNQTFPALVVGDSYINITKHIPAAPRSMKQVIETWDELKGQVAQLETATPDGKLSDATIEPPVARPGKIFAIGLNYADHCEETGNPLPEKQIWFTKATSAVHPPFAPIEIPAVSNTLDYEIEMVAIIGKRCRNVPAERFEEVIFGYATGNDVSVREWQIATPQWSLGKSFDTCAPYGPWITTSDSVDPHNLDVKCYVNDELRQDTNTKHLVFNVGAMVEQLSQAMTLEPGDLIFTGTSGGVGMMWKGSPHYLNEGDVVRCEIETLGTIETTVITGSSETFIG